MPYKDPAAVRLSNRERQRRYRDRQREKKRTGKVLTFPVPDDPVNELVRWSREKLVVPPGHPRAGSPMELPAFAVAFLRDALSHRESLYCCARKNAKSAIVAVLLLGRLVGPIRMSGYRAGVVSVNREKAGELKRQMQEIAEASDLKGIRFLRSPAPGRVESATGTVDILSADRSSGHAAGFDEAIIDELGLLHERDRELVNGMRTAISARDGRFIALSIMGDAPFTREMAERRDDPAVAVHLYQGDVDAALDDESQWQKANPGLKTGIKSLAYMRDEARRVLATPSDQSSFRAFDLNLPQDPSKEMLCSPDDLRACFVDELPERTGPAYLGIDVGEATSATAATAIWPASGRVECWMAYGDVPPIGERAKRDDAPYQQMVERGELRLYSGRVVHPDVFLADVQADLAGCRVQAVAADGYKDSEIRDYMDRAAVRWPIDFRRVGAGKTGGADVRSLQRLVLNGKLKLLPSLALVTAISKSTLRRDPNGNPGLDKSTSRGRIDLLSSAVIAAGLAAPAFDRPPPRRRVRVSIVR